MADNAFTHQTKVWRQLPRLLEELLLILPC
jgi:hypothetical protein